MKKYVYTQFPGIARHMAKPAILMAACGFSIIAQATNYSAGWTSITLSNNLAGQTSTYTLSATNPASAGSGCVNSCIDVGAIVTITFPAGTNAATATVAGSTFGGSAIASFTTQTATTLSFAAPASVAKGTPFTVVIQNVTNPPAAAYTTLSMTAANISPGTNTFSGGSSSYSVYPLPALVPRVLSAGWNHSMIICGDSTVQCWGQDTYGQLGDNSTNSNVGTPVAVSGLTGIVAVDGGNYHSLALKSDGTVWAWGQDTYGQLGDNTTLANQPTPVQVSGLSGILAISIGAYHSLALKSDGTVWSWGWNNSGQLGDNTTITQKPTPAQVAGLSGIIAVSAGGYHSLALKNDGTVWSWGRNSLGQLGNGSTSGAISAPAQVPGLTAVIAIESGSDFNLALKSNGQVWSWGSDNYGQLGDNAAYGTSADNKPSPVLVTVVTGIISVAAGAYHSVALKSDSTVWTWGWDSYGGIGDGGGAVNQPTPVQVGGLSGVSAIGAGWNHTLALKSDGTLWSWGYDQYGSLGNDPAIAHQYSPVQVDAGSLCTTTLPVTLLSFKALPLNNGSVRCEWETASETNNDYFEVERSLDVTDFITIGTVKAAGNSSSLMNYEFTDIPTDAYRLPASPAGGSPVPCLYYRLKQVDYNGNYTLSEVVLVKVRVNDRPAIEGVATAAGLSSIHFVFPSAGEMSYEILDITGNRVLSGTAGWVKEGRSTLRVSTSALPAGIYYVLLKSGQESVSGRMLLYE